MNRNIVGFHRDDLGDWVAELDCGHGQHVRHQPPFVSRPWTEAGRDSMLGTPLACRRCERLELPEGVERYRSTPEFDQDTVPRGLTRAHRTAKGVWGVIEVMEGRLGYVLEDGTNRHFELDAGTPGVVVSEMPHRVEPRGPVRFRVHFYRRSD